MTEDYLDLTFAQLMERAPSLLRIGATGAEMYVFAVPGRPDMGVLVTFNKAGRVVTSSSIFAGSSYLIINGNVRAVPHIEDDPNPVRRFCRVNGLPDTVIRKVGRGPSFGFGPTLGKLDPPVVLVTSPELRILVATRGAPRTYEQLVAIVKEWPQVKIGKLRY